MKNYNIEEVKAMGDEKATELINSLTKQLDNANASLTYSYEKEQKEQLRINAIKAILNL